MDPTALALVLSGSLLHIGWNAFAKGAEDKLAFLWLALLAPSAIGAFALVAKALGDGIDGTGLLLAGVSGVIHAAYFWLLAAAYRVADLSFVYPYSRGVGAAGATALGVSLLGEAPSALGYVGIGLTLVATFSEALLVRDRPRGNRTGVLLTIATGACIASYLVVDKVGVGHLEPAPYLGGLLLCTALILAPVLKIRGGVRAELARSSWRPFAASLFMVTAYGVVLLAMDRAPVSYVVAARATGIVASAVAGRLLFTEQVSGARLLSIALITVGVTFIGLA